MSGAATQAMRRLKIAELSAKIFGNTFNPTGVRTGNYILRQGFRAENIVQYYPSTQEMNLVKLSRMNKLFGMTFYDPDEIDRRNAYEKRKQRGKGPPKKGHGKRASLAKNKKK